MFAVPSTDQQGAAEADKVLAASPMMQVEGFFVALTNSNADGRVVVHKQGICFSKGFKEKTKHRAVCGGKTAAFIYVCLFPRHFV